MMVKKKRCRICVTIARFNWAMAFGVHQKPQLPGTALCSVEKQKQNKISKLVKDCHTSTNFHFKN